EHTRPSRHWQILRGKSRSRWHFDRSRRRRI
ncbi:LOW QUALITY PROTEIN: conserved hypothetical protein, partial [Brucella melitensis bv. 3 str. Ether]